MVVLRNGKASLAQLLVQDFGQGEPYEKNSFDVPDTGFNSPSGGDSDPNATNDFSANSIIGTIYYNSNHADGNVDGRYNAMAIGTGTTGASDTDTGLENEITSGGGGRRSDSDVKTYLTDDTSNDAWKANWETTWSFSSDFSVSEFGVHNKAGTNEGLCLMRQVLAEPLEIKSGDKLNAVLTLEVTGTDSTTAAPANQNVVTHNGLREIARLSMHPNTNRVGEDDTAGDWRTNYSINGTASRRPRPFDTIAIGDNATTNTNDTQLDNTNTTLTSELTANGGARQYGDTDLTSSGGSYVRGSMMQDPNDEPWDGTNSGGSGGGGDAFSTTTSNNFSGDTVQWVTKFTFSGTVDVAEQGVLNGTDLNDGDSSGAPGDDGVLLLHHAFVDTLDFDDTGRYQPIIRMQVT